MAPGGNIERESVAEGPARDRVAQRSFEALLADLDLPSSLSQALRAVGYELERPRAAYPLSTWLAATELVRRHLFPHLGVTAGLRALGRRSVRGFRSTAVGGALAPGLADLTVDRLLARLPRLYALGIPDARAEVHFLAERECRIEGLEAPSEAEMLAGVVEVWLEERGLTGELRVEPRGAGGALSVRW